MSRSLVVAGNYSNLLSQAAAVTCSPSADPLFPLPGLWDGTSEWAFRFSGDGAAAFYLQADLTRTKNPSMEGWAGGAPASWKVLTSGAGVVAEEATTKHSGTSGARVNPGTGTANIRQEYFARAGEKLFLDHWAAAESGGGAGVRIFNWTTGHALKSDGTWSADLAQYFKQTSSTSFVNLTGAFQIEDYRTCGADVALIEVVLNSNTASKNAFHDDCVIVPGVDFFSVHGHGVTRAAFTDAGAKLLSDPAGAFAGGETTQITFAYRRGSFYGTIGSIQYVRHWRLNFPGFNENSVFLKPFGPAWIGEAVLAQALSFQTGLSFPFQEERSVPQTRVSNLAGGSQAFPYTYDTLRKITLPVTFQGASNTDTAAWDELRHELMERTLNGVTAAVIVPFDDEPDTVILGRVPERYRVGRQFLSVRSSEIVLEELPPPQFVGALSGVLY